MVEVESEAIDEIDYDPCRLTMFVRFAHGGWYTYFGIGADIYDAFVAAQSHGRFFHEQIKNRYFYQRGR